MRLMPWWWGWGVKHILWQNEWVTARNWPWHLAWQQENRTFFTNSTQHIMFSEAKARNLKFFDDDRMSEIIITAWRNTFMCKETVFTWLLVTSQQWLELCLDISSWSSPPRPSSSRRGAPPCTASGQVSNCVMEKSPKYTYFGLSKQSILGWERWDGIFGVLIPATSWSWRCLASGWSLCGSVLVALGKC